MSLTLTEPIQELALGSAAAPRAKGGAAALRRRLFEKREAPNMRPWGGAFSNALVVPRVTKGRTESLVSAVGEIMSRRMPAHAGPGLLPIKGLHRHEDGFISFVTNGKDGWNQVVSIRADALDTYFPQFAEFLFRDASVSINASFCTFGQSPKMPYGRPLHRLSTLKYLNAVYADLDYYEVGLERWEVLAEVARMESEGILPPHSLTIDSGHGMWLFWMLHDPEDNARSHHGAKADDLQIYAKINRALHQRLVHLGADPIPTAASHVRMDGSFREENECFVRWDAHGAGGRAFSYSLTGLAAFFGVTARKRLPEEEHAIRQVSNPPGERSKAWIQCNQNRLTVLETLMDARGGGFFKGCRNLGAFYYALGLKGVGVSEEKSLEAVAAMGRDCSPPLRIDACTWAVKEAYARVKGTIRPVKVTYQRIADDLQVNPQEAQAISQSIGGKFFPAAQRFGHLIRATTPEGKETEEGRIANRQAAIQEVVLELESQGLPIPYLREMMGILQERYGIKVSHVTVRADYKALHLRSPYSPKVKPPRRIELPFESSSTREEAESL